MNTTTAPRFIGRLLTLVALFAMAVTWLASGAAWADPEVTVDELIIVGPTPEPPVPPVPPQPPEPKQPEGPGDLKQPPPEAGLAIKVLPDCERTPGFRYQIIPLNQPGPLSDYHALWSPAGGGGPVNAHPGQAGFVSSGEGEFTVSGHAVRDEKKYETKPVNVVVKCDDPERRPDPEPDPDKPRPGKPNFTG